MKNIGVKIKLFLLRARVRILDDVIIAQKLKIYNDFFSEIIQQIFHSIFSYFFTVLKERTRTGKLFYIVRKSLGFLILLS